MISTLLRGDYTAKNVGKINADARKRWEKKKRQQQLEKLSQDEWFNELKNKNYEYAKEYAYYKYGIKLETKNMNKKLIRLTESDLHRIVKESVDRILNEVGDTKRGQYMLGRLKNRQSARGINYNDAGDYAYKANGNSYSDDYQQGYEDEEKYGRNADSTWDGDKYRRMKFNYDTKQMEDMDNIGKRFIDFIEKHHGGALLQTIVDFETGNETGIPTSPLPTIIPEFEEAVVGHKCTPEMKKAIKTAYNQWWNYAEPMLTDNY